MSGIIGVGSTPAAGEPVEGANRGLLAPFRPYAAERRQSGDRLIARVAARQHGVVTIAQLVAAGVGRGAASTNASGPPAPGPSRRVCGGTRRVEQRGEMDGGGAGVRGRARSSATAAPRSCGRCSGASNRPDRRHVPGTRRPSQAPRHPPPPLPVTDSCGHDQSQGYRGHQPRPHARRPRRVRDAGRAPQGDPPGRSPRIPDR